MYLNFNLRKRNEKYFPYESNLTNGLDNNFNFRIEIDPKNCPVIEYKPEKANGKYEFEVKLVEGWNNYPLWKFIPEKYDAGEFPFEPFDYTEEQYFLEYERRLEIKQSIRAARIDTEMEFKALRKMLNKIIELHPELKELEEYKYFQRYNDTVEKEINKRPKEKKYFDTINIKKRNGVKE
jgi:hypothetical protein